MGLFGGKNASVQDLVRRVQLNQYTSNAELDDILAQLVERRDLKPRMLLPFLANNSPRVREWGSARLRDLAGGTATSLILEAMAGCEPRVRQELAGQVVKTDLRALFQVLSPLLHSKVKKERLVVLDVLAAHPKWMEFLGLLKGALKDLDPDVRRRAARVLRRGTGHPTIRLILLELLHDEDRGVRCEVLGALAPKPEPDLVEPFFARLPQEEPAEQRVMVDALSKLAADPNVGLEERLLPVLANENEQLRELAVRILASMTNRKRTLRTFLVHARGLATWLRERTTASILTMSDDLLDPLLELMQDPEDDIRVGAMVMAAQSKDPRVIPMVRGILDSDCDWWIKTLAADALAGFPCDEVVDALLAKLKDPDLRYTVVAVLGKLLNNRTVPVLIDCLRDNSRGIRLVALESLSAAQEPTVAQALAETAKKDPELSVREKAALLLEDFGGMGQHLLKEVDEHERCRAAAASSPQTLELKMANDTLNR